MKELRLFSPLFNILCAKAVAGSEQKNQLFERNVAVRNLWRGSRTQNMVSEASEGNIPTSQAHRPGRGEQKQGQEADRLLGVKIYKRK